MTARQQRTITKLLSLAFSDAPVDETMAIERQGWRGFELGHQLVDSRYTGEQFRAYAAGYADAAMRACVEGGRR